MGRADINKEVNNPAACCGIIHRMGPIRGKADMEAVNPKPPLAIHSQQQAALYRAIGYSGFFPL